MEGKPFDRFLADARGAAGLEYCLIAGGIALVLLVGVDSLRSELGGLQEAILSAIQSLTITTPR